MNSIITPPEGTIKLNNVILLSAVQLALLTISLNSYAEPKQISDKAAETKNQQIEGTAESSEQITNKAAEAKKPQSETTASSTEPDADKSNVTVLPAVTVKGKASDQINGYAAKRSMTGTKTDTPIIEIPQSISVVTRDELDMRSVQNFTEALRYTPGVTTDNFGFQGTGFENIFLRGFDGLTNANFRDGLSNAAQGLFFGSYITDPYGLERIDVLRGPSSVLFGRGDAGGIVNRVTKRPTADPIREIELQYGNFDRKRVAADLGFANKDGTLMFRLVTLGLDTDTQVKFPNTGGDRAFNRRFYIAPSVTWRPTVNTTITLMGDVLNNRTNAAAFYLAAPDGNRTNVLFGDPDFVKYSTNQSSFSYQIEHHFNEMFTARQNFRHTDQDGRFNDFFPLGYNTVDQPTLQDRSAFSTRERLNQTVIDTHLQTKLNTGPVHHTMLTGVDWNVTSASLKFFEGNQDGSVTPGIDILNPVYSLPIAKPDILGIHAKQKINQFGVYIQDQIRYDENWILTLSGRYDRVHSTDNDLLSAVTTKAKQDAFTGRAGLTYRFANGIAPYVSYSQSFLPQPGFDSSNNPFDPTRGTQYEVGIKFQPVGGRSLYTLALFDLTKTNVLTRDPNDPFRSLQTGEIGSRGAELEAKAELLPGLLPGLNFIGSFTYQEVTVTKSNDTNLDKMPILVPNTMASAWLDYSFRSLGIEWLRGLGIGGGVRYVGRVYNDPENTSTTSAFTLFDATLRYDYGPWVFNINASNIFNNKYVSSQLAGNFFLGTERTVVGTLKYRF
ncbi:TonB-dependent siderophore receptor [Nitrosomonas communis]|uniref:Iron complex outermembrane recepter protein n=1 Tax=Nitrosomonas communis TaxID=44574 RepID=A0A1H2T0D2_9PROT|nr:TonB-dependent siderophore receptor [Nitrosomonas communis]SDW37436.1 iron complex outermembrane recepter protein [Nitrosomonas communis]